MRGDDAYQLASATLIKGPTLRAQGRLQEVPLEPEVRGSNPACAGTISTSDSTRPTPGGQLCVRGAILDDLVLCVIWWRFSLGRAGSLIAVA